MDDPFENLPVIALADAEREARRAPFISAISKLPTAVRGTAVDVLFEIVAGWMIVPTPAPKPTAGKKIDPDEAAYCDGYAASFEDARAIIRAVLTRLRSTEPIAARYVTNVIKAADHRTMLYSAGSGEPTAAQPWLASDDHVLAAALAETHADTPELHHEVAHRVRTEVLMLAGVTPALAEDGSPLTAAEKVHAARERLMDVKPVEQSDRPGTHPTPDASFGIARAVCDYRNRQGLPVAEHNDRDGTLWPTADTAALAVATAQAWGVEVTPKKLGRQLRRYLARTMANPTHGLRADAEHIDWYNVGFEPPQ